MTNKNSLRRILILAGLFSSLVATAQVETAESKPPAADPAAAIPGAPESTAAAPSTTTPTTAPGTGPLNVPINADNYVVSTGDKISYRVPEDRDDPRTLIVLPAGEMDIPYLGQPVKIAGKTLAQAAQQIRTLLEKDLYYQATVTLTLVETAPPKPVAPGTIKPAGQVTITGAVKSPGIQEIPPNEKLMLSRAIIRAGGGTSFAKLDDVKISRKKKDGTVEHIKADVRIVLKEGKTDRDVELKPDDFVIVPESMFKW